MWTVIVGQAERLALVRAPLLETDCNENILTILRHVPVVDGIFGRRRQAEQTANRPRRRLDTFAESALDKPTRVLLHDLKCAAQPTGNILHLRLLWPPFGAIIAQSHLLRRKRFKFVDGIGQCHSHVVVERLSVKTSDHVVFVVSEESVEGSGERVRYFLEAEYDGFLLLCAILDLGLQLTEDARKAFGKLQVLGRARSEVPWVGKVRREHIVADNADCKRHGTGDNSKT